MAKYRLILQSPSENGLLEVIALATSKGMQPLLEKLDEAEPVRSPVNEQAKKPARTPANQGTSGGDFWAPGEAWTKLMSLINKGQAEVLQVIKHHPEGVTAEQIAEELGRDSTNSVTGTIGGGLRKNIPKAGFNDDDIVKTTRISGVWTYFPGPVLLAQEIPNAA